jgi:hypothetical protein
MAALFVADRRRAILGDRAMQGSGKWVLGALVGLLGLVGLFAASRAHDADMYLFGLIFFVATLIFIFGLIGSSTGRRPKH